MPYHCLKRILRIWATSSDITRRNCVVAQALAGTLAIILVDRAILREKEAREADKEERESRGSSLPICPGTPVASERPRPTGLTGPSSSRL